MSQADELEQEFDRSGGPIKPEPLARADLQANDAAWLLNKIWRRLNKRNEHFVAAFIGREGIGKSLTAAKTAECIDPDFNSDKIIFQLDDFLEILAEEEYSEGDMFVLDEAGVSLGNRTWQDRAQVLGNQALQLIRDHNIGLLFTLPRLSELDKQARGRLHLTFEIIDKQEDEFVTVKPKLIQPDRSGQTCEIYQKYPRRRRERDGVISRDKIRNIEIEPPSESVIDGYQEKKSEFQTGQYQRAIDKLRGNDGDDDEDEPATPPEIAEQILDDDDLEHYIKTHNNGAKTVLDWRTIANEFEIGRDKAKRVKTALLNRRDIDAV